MGSKSLLLLCLTSLFLTTTLATSYNLSCLNPSGESVAWSLTMKYPANLTTSNPRYGYMDSTYTSGKFSILSGYPDGSNSSLYHTITNINDQPTDNLELIVWNDEPPQYSESMGPAHSKGVLAYNNATGDAVYILHSAPRYPSVDSYGHIDYQLPDNTFMYAQHFYCVSLNQPNFQTALQNLQIIGPTIYYKTGPLGDLTYNLTNPVWISQFTLSSGDQQVFMSKNPLHEPYLYEFIIQPYLGVDLMTETWGRPYLPSLCAPEGAGTVLNIDYVQFPGDSQGWDRYSDHSKWAVTSGSNAIQYGCLCDMNRMETQDTRGGSCMCSNNQHLFAALNSIISTTDSCL